MADTKKVNILHKELHEMTLALIQRVLNNEYDNKYDESHIVQEIRNNIAYLNNKNPNCYWREDAGGDDLEDEEGGSGDGCEAD